MDRRLAKLSPEDRKAELHRRETVAREETAFREAYGGQEPRTRKKSIRSHIVYLRGQKPYLYDTENHKVIPMIEIK